MAQPSDRAVNLEADADFVVGLVRLGLDDVFEVADRVQVMRRGKRVGVVRTADVTTQDVLGMIVGAAEEAA